MPLPDDLASGLDKDKPEHPIKTLIRNGFRRNKRDASHRLIVSALKNGYRSLNLLSRAADPSTPEHASVISFIRENNERVLRYRAKKAAEKTKADAAKPIHGIRPPILTLVSGPDESPRYEPTSGPRPLESLPGPVRKPPTMGHTFGFPFLRFYKPQPKFLSMVLRSRGKRRQNRLNALIGLQTEDMPYARWEDQWEQLTENLLKKGKVPGFKVMDEGKGGDGERRAQRSVPKWARKARNHEGEQSFEQSLWDVVMHISDVANRERADMAARGSAMWKIVVAEQEQALKEKKEWLEKRGMGHLEPKLTVWRRPVWVSTKMWRNRKRLDPKTLRLLWKRRFGTPHDLRKLGMKLAETGEQLKVPVASSPGGLEGTGTAKRSNWRKIKDKPEETSPADGPDLNAGIQATKSGEQQKATLPSSFSGIKDIGNDARSFWRRLADKPAETCPVGSSDLNARERAADNRQRSTWRKIKHQPGQASPVGSPGFNGQAKATDSHQRSNWRKIKDKPEQASPVSAGWDALERAAKDWERSNLRKIRNKQAESRSAGSTANALQAQGTENGERKPGRDAGGNNKTSRPSSSQEGSSPKRDRERKTPGPGFRRGEGSDKGARGGPAGVLKQNGP